MQRAVQEEATDCEEHEEHHAVLEIQDLNPQNENRTQNQVRTSVQAAYIETMISGVDNGSVVNARNYRFYICCLHRRTNVVLGSVFVLGV